MDEYQILPLPIMETDGSIKIVCIPRMTPAAFEFFKTQLDLYSAAIITEITEPKASESNPAADEVAR